MNTLSISQIFSNFEYYQDNYLHILQTQDEYYTEVEGAFIHVWPFQKKKLYLGDLLQLWFAEKWQITTPHQYKLEEYLAAKDTYQHDLTQSYIYAIVANALTTKSQAQIYTCATQQSQSTHLSSSLKHYCEFLACQRPNRVYSNRFERFGF